MGRLRINARVAEDPEVEMAKYEKIRESKEPWI